MRRLVNQEIDHPQWKDIAKHIRNRFVIRFTMCGRSEKTHCSITHTTHRTGKQCRERWLNHLDPSIKKEPWTEEEDQLLLEVCGSQHFVSLFTNFCSRDRSRLQIHAELGNKWSKIAKLIPGSLSYAYVGLNSPFNSPLFAV